jgi:two-component system chemotaxis response regulator CheB
VLVLDVEMPELDGRGAVSAIRELGCKVPIIMFSTLTKRGRATTLECIGSGANDYVAKPSTGDGNTKWSDMGADLLKKLRSYGRAQQQRNGATAPRSRAPAEARTMMPAGRGDGRSGIPSSGRGPTPVAGIAPGMASRTITPTQGALPKLGGLRAPAVPRELLAKPVGPVLTASSSAALPAVAGNARSPARTAVRNAQGRPLIRPDVVLVASSMGGPDALPVFFSPISQSAVPICVVQHMPASLTEALKTRIERACGLPVRIAEHNAVARPGEITICPGWKHLMVRRDGAQIVCLVDDAPPVAGAKPAADRLFASAAQTFGPRALAIVLTGMGSDGLAGARQLVEAGSEVIVQDQKSSAAWGMPGGIAGAGLAAAVLPLNGLAEELRVRLSAIPGREEGAKGWREACRVERA